MWLVTEDSFHKDEQATTTSTRDVWRRALFKIKVRSALKNLREDLLIYGTTNDLTDFSLKYKPHIDELIARKQQHSEAFRKQTSSSYLVREHYHCLFHPDYVFLKTWHVLVSLMLFYTGTVMPYRVAFAQDVYWDWWTALEAAIDCLFLLDIAMSFFSIRVRPDGSLDTDNRSIAVRYLRGWFAVDVVASVPYTLIDFLLASDESQKARYNTLLRLVRIPRLYRLLRLLRILRTFRTREGSVLLRVQDLTMVNLRFTKLMQFLMTLWAAVHIAACVWYFTARASNFEAGTWVARYELLDSEEYIVYLRAFYWSVTTMVTVGYGDIVPFTSLEQVFVISWMLIGAGFYSYTIGSLSAFFTSIDTLDSILSAKTEAIMQMAEQTGIHSDVREELLAAIKYSTFSAGATWDQSLFDELPKQLRAEVVSLMYKGLTRTFPFFSKRDAAFSLFVVPLLHSFRFGDKDCLYRAGEYADAMYFITRGRLNFVFAHSEVVYKAYLKGSYVGEIELIRRIPRQDTVLPFGDTEVLTLEKVGFEAMTEEFPLYAKEIRRHAAERERRNKQAMMETQELLQMKDRFGSLQHLAGHERLALQVNLPDLADSGVSEEVLRLSEAAKSSKSMSLEAASLANETEALLSKALQKRKFLL